MTRRRVAPAEVRAELDSWEAKYGVPSDRLIDAFRDPKTGKLVESEDFHRWMQTYDIRQHVSAS